MSETKTAIHAVLYQDGDRWVGVCLEHYILAMGDTVSELVGQLRKGIEASLVISMEKGVAPFEGIPRSPQRYWDLYDQARPSESLRPADSPPMMPTVELRTASQGLAA